MSFSPLPFKSSSQNHSDPMNTLSETERQELSALLTRKISGVPQPLLTLTLEDILNQTPTATHIPTIPPDLQLPFFLTHRSIIHHHHDNTATKDPTEQSLNLTRAIFFYRLDESHQFQRYHDSLRWNIAIFLALLGFHLNRPEYATRKPGTHYYISPTAKDFMIAFLSAVIEHHNSPTVFDRREEFVSLWKRSPFDFFEFTASQRKLVKRSCRRISGEFENVWQRLLERVGREEYERRFRPFVNVLVHGKEEQGFPRDKNGMVVEERVAEGEQAVERNEVEANVDGENGEGENNLPGAGQDVENSAVNRSHGTENNELLKALRVPFDVGTDDLEGLGAGTKGDGKTFVINRSAAIDALGQCREADIVEALERIFS